MSTNIRSLTEGALTASIYIVLLLFCLYIPFLTLAVFFLLFLPFVLYSYRHGIKASIGVLFVTIVITLLVGGLPFIIFPLMSAVGIVLGYLYKKEKSTYALLLGTSLYNLIFFLLSMVGTYLVLNINIIDSVNQMIDEYIKTIKTIGSTLDFESSNIVNQLNMVKELVITLMPFAIIVSSFIYGLITVLISNALVKRFKIKVNRWIPFREWRLPKVFIWYYLASIILVFFSTDPNSTFNMIAMNLFYLLEVIMVVQGLSFVYFYFWEKKKSNVIPNIIAVATFLIPVLGFYVIRILGIIDLGFNLRKRVKT